MRIVRFGIQTPEAYVRRNISKLIVIRNGCGLQSASAMIELPNVAWVVLKGLRRGISHRILLNIEENLSSDPSFQLTFLLHNASLSLGSR